MFITVMWSFIVIFVAIICLIFVSINVIMWVILLIVNFYLLPMIYFDEFFYLNSSTLHSFVFMFNTWLYIVIVFTHISFFILEVIGGFRWVDFFRLILGIRVGSKVDGRWGWFWLR